MSEKYLLIFFIFTHQIIELLQSNPMHFFRRLLNSNKLGVLLLTGIMLRSLVASGYMLDTNAADGALLSIKLCDGPSAINTSTVSGHDSHEHHHPATNEHHHDDHDLHDGQHFLSACSFWSASSQLLLTAFSLDGLLDQTQHAIIIHQATTVAVHAHNRTRLARAPPALS